MAEQARANAAETTESFMAEEVIGCSAKGLGESTSVYT